MPRLPYDPNAVDPDDPASVLAWLKREAESDQAIVERALVEGAGQLTPDECSRIWELRRQAIETGLALAATLAARTQTDA